MNSTTTTNTVCSSDPSTIYSGISYFILNFSIAVFGAFGNACSLWCLLKCDKTSAGAKIQLVTFFGFQFLVCVLSLPGFSLIRLMALLCRANELYMEFKLIILIVHTVFLTMERMNFAVMAVMRMLAVCWNNGYKKLVRTRNIIILELSLFTFIVTPWIVYISIGLYQKYPIEDQMTVSFSEGKPVFIQRMYLLYAINHLLPTFISFVAYSVMIYAMYKKKMTFFIRKIETTTTTTTKKTVTRLSTIMENVAYAIRLLILINIFLDLPHTISHLLKISHIPSLFIHSIFYSHLIFDPLIFVGMNAYYRKLIGWVSNRNSKDNAYEKTIVCHCSCNCCYKNNEDDDYDEDHHVGHPPFHRAVVVSGDVVATHSTISSKDWAIPLRNAHTV